MRIEQIHIQKFRSLDDVTINCDQVLALVGSNNAGKSHVLRALNVFFNYESELEGFEHQDHVFSLKSRPKITVTFGGIENSDGIPQEYLFNDKLKIRFTYRWDRKTPSYEIIIAQVKKTISKESFDSIMSGFKYIYVPIARNSDEVFSNENGLAFSFLESIVQQLTAKRNTLQPLVNKLYQKMEDTVFKTALQRIRQYYPFKNPSDFKLQITNNDVVSAIVNDVTIELYENSQHNNIKNCGSGIQSAIYYAIMLAKTMDNDTSYMIGVEEPELNMHPQAQRELIESFKDTNKYPHSQFILTTHSTVIIDHLGHQSIALCRKQKGQTRDVITTIKQIDNSFWEKYEFTEERYNNFFEYKNSDFFFSNFIVIAEGSVDCGVFSHVLKMQNINAAEQGITFIPTNGEKSIKYPYAIAKELEIPFVCVVDRDAFQAYIGKNREESIDSRGLPQYKPELKRSSPICSLLNENEKRALLTYFCENKYGKVCDLLEQKSIISMRYALEIDLINCSSFCNSYYEVLNIVEDNRTPQFLAKERSESIKKAEIINSVLDRCSTRCLPISYRRIIQNVKQALKSL